MGKYVAKTVDQAMGMTVQLIMRKNNRLADAVWTELVDETPVDTGTARASWIYTPGRPATRVPAKKEYAYPPKPDFYKYTLRWRQWFITNNQAYIQKLNNGSSQQNTRIGWVDAVVQRNVAKANSGGFGFGFFSKLRDYFSG